jgi:hypothetical protein
VCSAVVLRVGALCRVICCVLYGCGRCAVSGRVVSVLWLQFFYDSIPSKLFCNRTVLCALVYMRYEVR